MMESLRNKKVWLSEEIPVLKMISVLSQIKRSFAKFFIFLYLLAISYKPYHTSWKVAGIT